MIRDIAAAAGSGTRWRPDIVRRLVSPVALAVAVVAAVTDPAGWIRPMVLAVAVAAFLVWQRGHCRHWRWPWACWFRLLLRS